jgi:tetratricopeptide (TPR) repeat protein
MKILSMDIKYYRNMLKTVLTLLLFAGAFLCFPIGGYAQEGEEQEEQEEGPELTREAQVALVAAQDLYQQEKFAEARQPLLEFLDTQPEVIPEILYLMLGQIWYMDENFEEAMKVWKTGYEAFPESDEMLRSYAVATYYAEHYVEAGRLFEEYYDILEEKDLEYLNNAAGAFYLGEDLDEAKRVFKRMIDLPGVPKIEWLDTVIQICFEQEDIDEAQESVLMALDYYPLNDTYWQWLFNIRIEKEDYLGGTSALEIQYHIKPPEDKDLWKNLTDLYGYLNVPLRVAEDLPKSFQDKVLEDEYIQVARAYASAMRIDKAVSYLDGQISKNPTSGLMLEKGRLLLNARRNEDAIKALDECIEFDPNNGEAYLYKGFAAWDLEDWDTTRDAFEGALDVKDYKEQAKNYLSFMDDLEEAKKD